MKFIGISALSCAGLLVALMLHANPYAHDAREWSRIEIREAFISRQTSLDFADAASAPEFGWHLTVDEELVMRSDRLYPIMFAPVLMEKPARLVLVELDIVYDDIVSAAHLEPGVSRYVLNANGDFVILERKPFFPDANSGTDAEVKGALPVTGDIAGSVSFLDGDYTDWLRLGGGLTTALVFSDGKLGDVSIPGDKDGAVHAGERSFGTAFIIACGKPGAAVRIRGPIGSGAVSYRVLPAGVSDPFGALLERAMKHLDTEGERAPLFIYDDLAQAFLSFDASSARARCAADGNKNSRASMRKFCEAVREADAWGR